MQPTELQVERSLQALQRAPLVDELALVAGGAGLDPVDDEVPDGLLDRLLEAPPVRLDRLAEARTRLANGAQPSDDDLARRLVGRLVCDRLR
jgi:hypothetical protein